MDTELMLDAGADHIVEFPKGSIVIDPVFGYEKEGDALGSLRSTFDTGKNRMDDIFGKVMLASGDENLLSGDGKCAVIIFFGGGGESPHIGTGSRFGEEHGAGPLARVHLFEKDLLLFICSKLLHKLSCAVGEPRVHHEGIVGTVEIFGCGRGDGSRHSLTSPLGILGHCKPFTLVEQFVEPLEGCGGGHLSVLQGASLLVTLFLGGQNLFYGKITGL